MLGIPFNKIGQYIKSIFSRYPAAIVCSILAFTCVLLYNHNSKLGHKIGESTLFCLTQTFALGITVFSLLHLLLSNFVKKIEQKVGLFLLGYCILGLFFYYIYPFRENSDQILLFKISSIHISFVLLVLSALFFKETETPYFFNFANSILYHILIATLFSLTLFAGISLAMWGIDMLFGLSIKSVYYFDLFFGILFLFFTAFVLYNLQNEREAYKQARPFTLALKIFIQYILIPLLLLYALILAVYFIKLILNNKIPQAYVCIPILIFSIIGLVAIGLSYQVRVQPEYRWIGALHKYFFYVLMVFMAVYYVAIIHRINLFGLTEARALCLIGGVLFVVIALSHIVNRKVNYVLAIVLTSFLLLLSNIGPLNMYDMSSKSQFKRLQHLLVKYYKSSSTQKDSAQAELYNLTTYVYDHHDYLLLNQLPDKNGHLAKVSTDKPWALNDYFKFWDIDTKNFAQFRGQQKDVQTYYLNFTGNNQSNQLYKLEGHTFQLRVNLYNSFTENVQDNNEEYELSLLDGQLVVMNENKKDTFKTAPLLRQLYLKHCTSTIGSGFSNNIDIQEQRYKLTLNTNQEAMIYPTQIQFSVQSDSTIQLEHLDALIIF